MSELELQSGISLMTSATCHSKMSMRRLKLLKKHSQKEKHRKHSLLGQTSTRTVQLADRNASHTVCNL